MFNESTRSNKFASSLCAFRLYFSRDLSSKRRILPPGDTTINPLNWMAATQPPGTPYISETIGKEVTDPDYSGELGLPLHNGYKQKYVWNT